VWCCSVVQNAKKYRDDGPVAHRHTVKTNGLRCVSAMSACDNARCSDVCLLNDQGGYSCACAAGKALDYDQHTCTGNSYNLDLKLTVKLSACHTCSRIVWSVCFCCVTAKFNYAIWFEAGRRPASNKLGTCYRNGIWLLGLVFPYQAKRLAWGTYPK